MGAWIETERKPGQCFKSAVAPRVGAWIETFPLHYRGNAYMSHPVWVRGLKLVEKQIVGLIHVSHPVWVRGLKL